MRQFLIYRLHKMRWSIAAALLITAFIYVTQAPKIPTSQANQQTNLVTLSEIDLPLWTSTKTMTAEQNALAHFKKHGSEMGFKNAADYVRAAHVFLRNPPLGTETKTEDDGDILRYNETTGQFGVMRKDGAPRTFFIPDKDHPNDLSNRAYFDRQE